MIPAFMILAFLKYLGSILVMNGIWFVFILIISATITMIPSLATSKRLLVQFCYPVIITLIDCALLFAEHAINSHFGIFSLFAILFLIESIVTTYILLRSSIWPLNGTLKSLGYFGSTLAITIFGYHLAFHHPLLITVITLLSFTPLHSHSLWAPVVLAILGKGYLLLFFGIMINAFATNPQPSPKDPLPEWFWRIFVYSAISHHLAYRYTPQPRSNLQKKSWIPRLCQWVYRIPTQVWQRWQDCLFSIFNPYFKQANRMVQSNPSTPAFLKSYLVFILYVHYYFDDLSHSASSRQTDRLRASTIQQLQTSSIAQSFDNDYLSAHSLYENQNCYCGSHTPQCPRTLRACFETVARIPRHQLPQSWC